jgi:SsrA-binding protein
MNKNNEKVITTNRKALHDYTILDKIEAGIVLKGSEVKSLREGRANLKDSYAKIKNDEIYLIKSHISPYTHTGYDNHEPERDRKLLLHKSEMRKLKRNVETKGVSLIPLRMYFNDKDNVKVEIGLAKGKRLYDKRASLAEKEAKREIDRARKGKY